MPLAVTREDFAGLVADLRAELAAAGAARRDGIRSHMQPVTHAPEPEAFTGRPWTAAAADLREAGRLTGYSWNTLHVYAAPAAARHWTHARFPPPVLPRHDGAGRKWRLGQLAIWAADRDPSAGNGNLAARYPARPAHPRRRKDWSGLPPKATATRRNARRRKAAAQFAAGLITRDPAVTMTAVRTAAGAAGVDWARWRQVMDAARAAVLPAILDDITPRDPSGHATAAEIARAFGITPAKVQGAMGRGEIRAARHGRHLLADPARLRYRRETGTRATMPAPADQDHPAAVPLPGDIKEETR